VSKKVSVRFAGEPEPVETDTGRRLNRRAYARELPAASETPSRVAQSPLPSGVAAVVWVLHLKLAWAWYNL